MSVPKEDKNHKKWDNLLEWLTYLPQPINSTAAFIKHFGLSGLVGVVVGLILSFVLIRTGWWPGLLQPKEKISDTVYLVGSGTVRSYLAAADTNLAQNSRLENIGGTTDIHLLEGASGTGTKLFADVYDQVHIMAMASNKRELEGDLARYPDNKPAVFEAYLGTDPLQVILVAENDELLQNTFPDLLSIESSSELRLEMFIKYVWQEAEGNEWDTPNYLIYATVPPSATRAEWDSLFMSTNPTGRWPKSFRKWEPQLYKEAEAPLPSIFLGSRVLNKEAVDLLDELNIAHEIFYIWHDSGLVTRDLYLYGRVLKETITRDGVIAYGIPSPVANALEYVYDLLRKANPEEIDDSCISQQREYFHLNDRNPGWVNQHPGGHDAIYRAPNCKKN